MPAKYKRLVQQTLDTLCELNFREPSPALEKAIGTLRVVLGPTSWPRASRLTHKSPADKRAARDAEWLAIREKVRERAGVRCEHCDSICWPQADHMFGGFGRRRTLESKFTVWALCPTCHRQKTANTPSAGFWLKAFIVHCNQCLSLPDAYGYQTARAIAVQRLDALQIQGRAP